MAENSDEIRPFRIDIPQTDLEDLQDRLARTRWTDELPLDTDGPQTGSVPPGWEYDVPLEYVKNLVERWRTGYDWREWEARLNSHPQFTTTVDGQTIHFLHVCSPEPGALPLILTHGWPNTVLEYLQFLQGFLERAVHDKVQEAQPQTIAHALADSPAGQLAWSGQLFGEALDPDEILTNASIYWLTNTAASAARFYYENKHADQPTGPTTAPIGLASFAYDFRPIRRFAERDHANIVSWSEFDSGGHWSAHDAPDLLTGDIRRSFRRFR